MKSWCAGYFYHDYYDQLVHTLERKKNILGDIEYWYPKISSLVVKDGKKEIIKEPIFDNYILFNLERESLKWMDITRHTPIMKFLKSDKSNEVLFIPEHEIAHIKELESVTLIESYSYLIGQKVLVAKGPYKGMEGSCKSIIKGVYKAKIHVNLFNIVKKEVEINLEDLEVI